MPTRRISRKSWSVWPSSIILASVSSPARHSEALACGSRSTTSTRLAASSAASASARLTTVVVLPTPPFMLATAISLPPEGWLRSRWGSAGCGANVVAAATYRAERACGNREGGRPQRADVGLK